MNDADQARRMAELKSHVLTEIVSTPEVRVFKMAQPGTRMMSVDVVFTAGRIWLSGDLIVGDGRGVISDLSYGLNWFAGQLGADYLAEKFLRKRFVPELAICAMHTAIGDLREQHEGEEMPEMDAMRIRRLEEALEDADDHSGVTRHAEAFHDFWCETMICYEGEGYGYDPTEQGWLAAIQERFAELYAAMAAGKAASMAGSACWSDASSGSLRSARPSVPPSTSSPGRSRCSRAGAGLDHDDAEVQRLERRALDLLGCYMLDADRWPYAAAALRAREWPEDVDAFVSFEMAKLVLMRGGRSAA